MIVTGPRSPFANTWPLPGALPPNSDPPTVTLVSRFSVQIWPGFGVGWFGTGADPDGSLPSKFAHQRILYEETQILPLAALLVLAVVFFWWGQRYRATGTSSA